MPLKSEEKTEKPRVEIDLHRCVGCWNCQQRCPEHAINMIPCDPYTFKTDVSQFEYKEIEALCRKARFHPKQVVCYCSASRAEELAAAILAGAKTPDAVVLATGIGAGCGIECNQPIQRFLEAAGFRPGTAQRKLISGTVEPQQSGRCLPEIKRKHPVFRFVEDRELMDRIVNTPIKS